MCRMSVDANVNIFVHTCSFRGYNMLGILWVRSCKKKSSGTRKNRDNITTRIFMFIPLCKLIFSLREKKSSIHLLFRVFLTV